MKVLVIPEDFTHDQFIYGRICQMCPEVAQLENRIGGWMATNS